jgi:hypothetical protein
MDRSSNVREAVRARPQHGCIISTATGTLLTASGPLYRARHLRVSSSVRTLWSDRR